MSKLNCRCDQCGELYVVTRSGGVCPNMHGGVIPRVRQRDVDRVHARQKELAQRKEYEALQASLLAKVKALPLCRYVRQDGWRWWAVDGHVGSFQRVAGPYMPSTLDGLEPHHRVAGHTLARTADNRWCALKEIR